MEFSTLGRTGLRVSVAGLGCGGASRLGLSHGKSEADAVAIVRGAIDQGVNLIDTARNYRTEGVVGKAIVGIPRESIVLCTKAPIRRKEERIDPSAIRAHVEDSLSRMRTDTIDVFYLHGVVPQDYDFAVSECLPVLDGLRDSGKVRFIGLTERFASDTTHGMLVRATAESHWDVVMTGFNILNQTAREIVFPQTIERGIGTTLMFAVRRAFSKPEALREAIERLLSKGHENLRQLDQENLLGFLVRSGGAHSLTDAAYRFCRHEPGVDCVLFGTGNVEHLRENIASILRPPLPESDRARLRKLFDQVNTESGN